MSASITTNDNELPPLRFMTDEQKEAEFNELFQKVHGHKPPTSSDLRSPTSDPSPSSDLPAYEDELAALAEKLKGHERPDPGPSPNPERQTPNSSPNFSPNSKLRTPNSLHSKFTPIGGGRFHVTVERGALAHTDALRLASERQRLRFAQACDAKVPGCFSDVLSLLEKEAVKQPFKGDAKNDDGCRILFTPASSFLPESVDWVWENYIPAASVTILEGDPGVGKSLLLADLAARVSRGLPMPDRSPAFDEPGHDPNLEPGLVWWFSGHDHPEQTLAPRLSAAGADMHMIRVAEGVEDRTTGAFRPVAFPQDFFSLWKGRAASPRLVIIDPLSSFCGGAHNHQAAQKALTQLTLFARETGAAILVVRPLNRRIAASASERGAGPLLLAEARSALLLAHHPDDPARRVLAVVKSNLCAPAPSLELQIQSAPLPNSITCSPDPLLSSPHPSPIICWLNPSLLTVSDLTRSPSVSTPARSPFEARAVEQWLTEKLSSGPRLASDITTQAQLDSIPPILLRRAQVFLNIIPTGRNGSTTWTLPDVGWASPTTIANSLVGGTMPRVPPYRADPGY